VGHLELTRGPFSLSTDPRRLDVDAIHAYLSRSFWAEGIPTQIFRASGVFYWSRAMRMGCTAATDSACRPILNG
jgi:hypothetical protein